MNLSINTIATIKKLLEMGEGLRLALNMMVGW